MCEAGIHAYGDWHADFILIEVLGKSVVVVNREMVHSFIPIFACPGPVDSDVAQGQPD